MQTLQQLQPPVQPIEPTAEPHAQLERSNNRSTRAGSERHVVQRLASQPTWVKSALIWPHATPIPQDVTLPQALLAGGSPLDVALTSATGSSLTSAIQKLPLGPGQVLTWQWVKSTASHISGGQNTVLAMQQAWLNTSTAAISAAPDSMASAAVGMLRSAFAHRAAQVLQEDEDDLFFEGGKSMAEFSQALENGQVAPGFLDAMAIASTYAANAAADVSGAGKLWTQILKDGFSKIDKLELSNPASFEAPLRTLDILTQSATLRECLGVLLLHDASQGDRIHGNELESGCVIAPLLRISALPKMHKRRIFPIDFPAKACFMGLRNYPKNRGSQIDSEIGSIRSSLQRVYTAAHEILKRIATLKPATIEIGNSTGGKEIIAAWFAAVTGSNIARSQAGSYLDRVLVHKKSMTRCSSDAFLIAATAVSLRFCRPFMATKEKKEGALVHLSSEFYVEQAYRVVGVAEERTLAGNVPYKEDKVVVPYPALSPDQSENPRESSCGSGRGSGAPPHFVAEMFFATQRLIRVGFVPAMYRYQAIEKMMKRQNQQGAANGDDQGDEFGSSVSGKTTE